MTQVVDLSGKVAVITGAGSGLGAAMGRVFAQAGAAVAVLDIDDAAAQQAAAFDRAALGPQEGA